MTPPLRVLLDQPEIPGNTGNIIRLAAVVGFELHIAGPTLFEFTDARLQRAGLDYHELAVMTEHEDLEAAYSALGLGNTRSEGAGRPQAEPRQARPCRVFAFTGRGTVRHTDLTYQAGDTLLFGRESTGLDQAVLEDPRITELVRIPMRPGLRSLNLANSVSIAAYEAWRQRGFAGAQ